MSESKHQQQAGAPAGTKPRKDWELFWRIIAGLMLLVIGWIAWVLYQITPRSVVTPLVYEAQVSRGGAKQPEAGATASPQPAAVHPPAQEAASAAPAAATPERMAAALLMDQAQAAMRAGAHQASADVQAARLEQRIEAPQGEKLKLATEIATPPVEKKIGSAAAGSETRWRAANSSRGGRESPPLAGVHRYCAPRSRGEC